MAYTYVLDPTTPATTDPVNQGPAIIQEFKNAVLERINSFFVDANVKPLTVQDNATFGAMNVKTLTPVAANTYDIGSAGTPFRSGYFQTQIVATSFVGALTGNVTGNVSGSAGTATSATTAGTVTTAAQPAITSVGTLTALAVTGAVTAGSFVGNGSGITGLPATVSLGQIVALL